LAAVATGDFADAIRAAICAAIFETVLDTGLDAAGLEAAGFEAGLDAATATLAAVFAAGFDINLASGEDMALDVAFVGDFAALAAAGLVEDFVTAALPRALRATNAAVDGRAPRVVAAATRRADFDAGFLACVRALLCALAPLVALVAFLALRRDALAGRRAVLLECVPMSLI
jgi:hypothetical protein